MQTAVSDAIESVTSALLEARSQRERWEERERELLGYLLGGHNAGDVPTTFVASGYKFALQPGRKTVVYPPTVTAEIKVLQAEAVEKGLTTEKVGSPFWRISVAKEDAA